MDTDIAEEIAAIVKLKDRRLDEEVREPIVSNEEIVKWVHHVLENYSGVAQQKQLTTALYDQHKNDVIEKENPLAIHFDKNIIVVQYTLVAR